VDTGVSADVGIVFNDHVSGERGRICHDHSVADDAIVRNVSLGHDQTVVAYLSQHSTAGGAAMNRYKLPNHIASPDARFGWLAFVLQILSGKAD
jgi:hypothetical protein